jgi:hypothetical protein
LLLVVDVVVVLIRNRRAGVSGRSPGTGRSRTRSVWRRKAELIEVGGQHAGRVAPTVSPPCWRGRSCRAASSSSSSKLPKKKRRFGRSGPPPSRRVAVVEGARIERPVPLPLRCRPVLVAELVVEGTAELVGAAARHRVDARADEVALPHVERRDVDLHLLDRVERDGRDARALARRPARPNELLKYEPSTVMLFMTGCPTAGERDGRQRRERVAARPVRSAGRYPTVTVTSSI